MLLLFFVSENESNNGFDFLWRNYHKAKIKGQQQSGSAAAQPGDEHGLTVLLKDTLAWIRISVHNCQALLLPGKETKKEKRSSAFSFLFDE